MPTYTFTCDECYNIFEIFCSYAEYTDKQKCTKCHSKKTSRLYAMDLNNLAASVKKSDSELKTLGDLAKRNADRMSDDQKHELYVKHNNYKEEPSDKPLPEGMSRIQKQPKTIWPR